MATAVNTARHCIICNIQIISTKSYRSLLVDENMPNERRLAAKVAKEQLRNELSAAVNEEVIFSKTHSVICMSCLRRAKRIPQLQKDLEAERNKIQSDFKKTHGNENRPPATPDKEESTSRKRLAEGTPSKFSPSSKAPSRKRTSLFKEPNKVNQGIKYEVCFRHVFITFMV